MVQNKYQDLPSPNCRSTKCYSLVKIASVPYLAVFYSYWSFSALSWFVKEDKAKWECKVCWSDYIIAYHTVWSVLIRKAIQRTSTGPSVFSVTNEAYYGFLNKHMHRRLKSVTITVTLTTTFSQWRPTSFPENPGNEVEWRHQIVKSKSEVLRILIYTRLKINRK